MRSRQLRLSPQGRPKLLVVISVDQFSADLWDEYRPHFTGGLARLGTGAAFHNGYQSHAATETCPGHSTILTGDHPSRTGIIANVWTDQSAPRADKTVYCAEDETRAGHSRSTIRSRPASDGSDAWRVAQGRAAGSRNVAVAGKDRAAVMMTGHKVDQRWYWTGKTFETDLKAHPCRKVTRANAAIAAALRKIAPLLDPPAFCQAKARAFAVEGGGKPVGAGRVRAQRRRRGRLPRVARARRRHARDRRRTGRRDAARPRARSRRSRDQPLGDRLCRPHLRHRRAGDVPATARARPRARRFPGAARLRAGSIMPWP